MSLPFTLVCCSGCAANFWSYCGDRRAGRACAGDSEVVRLTYSCAGGFATSWRRPAGAVSFPEAGSRRHEGPGTPKKSIGYISQALTSVLISHTLIHSSTSREDSSNYLEAGSQPLEGPNALHTLIRAVIPVRASPIYGRPQAASAAPGRYLGYESCIIANPRSILSSTGPRGVQSVGGGHRGRCSAASAAPGGPPPQASALEATTTQPGGRACDV